VDDRVAVHVRDGDFGDVAEDLQVIDMLAC
jgi:hypothetical protein